ncbi:MAG: lysophospholipid acyltransferase family protein [Pyrinomonadaceae bacterium]
MDKRSRIRTNVEYAVARCLISGLGLLPLRVAVAIGRTMGRVAYLVSRSLRRTGMRNLELAFPEMTEDERRRILRGCFINLGRLLGQFSHLSTISPESLGQIVYCEGLENLDAVRGRGVILLTGHLGAWELTSFALSCFGYPLSFLVRRLDNPRIEGLIEEIRTRFGNRTIDKRSAGRPMLRSLRGGDTLGLLVDVNMLAHEGIFVDFLGTPASTTFLMAKLALRTGAVVIPVFAPWEEQQQRFVLHIGAPLTIENTGDEAEDIRRLTSLATETVEWYVRRYPDQWLWIHKRWRTRPAGEPDLYRIAN